MGGDGGNGGASGDGGSAGGNGGVGGEKKQLHMHWRSSVHSPSGSSTWLRKIFPIVTK